MEAKNNHRGKGHTILWRILALYLFLAVPVANAAGPSPCYWFTVFVRCFPTGGLNIPAITWIDTTKGISGTTAIDDAQAGYVGQYMENKTATGSGVGASTQWFNAGSLTLTAGDWDVWGEISYTRNSATVTSVELDTGISTVTGNSGSGLVEAATLTFFAPGALATYATIAVQSPVVRVQSNGTDLKINGSTLAGTQVVFLKGNNGTYTGSPQYGAIIRARRIR